MKRIVCTGGRDYQDFAMVWDFLNATYPDEVYVGDCPTGLDQFVTDSCAQMGITCRIFNADWGKHGKAAGPIRNRAMLEAAASGCTPIVFVFPGGRGTADCVRQAVAMNLIVCEVK